MKLNVKHSQHFKYKRILMTTLSTIWLPAEKGLSCCFILLIFPHSPLLSLFLTFSHTLPSDWQHHLLREAYLTFWDINKCWDKKQNLSHVITRTTEGILSKGSFGTQGSFCCTLECSHCFWQCVPMDTWHSSKVELLNTAVSKILAFALWHVFN